MSWTEAVGYLTSALVFATFGIKTMVPPREAAISTYPVAVSSQRSPDEAPRIQDKPGLAPV